MFKIYDWNDIKKDFNLENYPQGIIIENMPNKVYHSMQGVSSTVLKNFLPEKSPYKWYYETFIKKPEYNHNFAFGNAAHEYILENITDKEFLKKYSLLPFKSYWGVSAEKMLEEELAKNKIVILEKDFECIKEMKKSIQHHEFALSCFADSYQELSLFAKHPVHNVWIKARPDSISKDLTTFNDYKTTKDSSPFGIKQAIVNYNYDISAAWYINIIKLIADVDNKYFYWIFQQKTEPYLVNVSIATDVDLANGFELCEIALSNYIECKENNYYPHWLNDRGEPTENIHVAYLPEYYKFKVDKQLGRLD